MSLPSRGASQASRFGRAWRFRISTRRYYGQKLEIPELEKQTLDTVRRIGGWRSIKQMESDDFPFVQKRFFEGYRAWMQRTQPSIAKEYRRKNRIMTGFDVSFWKDDSS